MQTKVVQSHGRFVRFYNASKHKLFTYFFLRLQDRATSEDLVQDTVLKAYRGFERYDERQPFETWIYSIARNTLIDHYRKNRDASRPMDLLSSDEGSALDDFADLSVEDPYRSLDDSIRSERVRIALGTLPEKQRACIALRYDEELTDEAIASRLDMTRESVRKNVSRGVKALQKLLLSLILFI